MKRSLTIAMLTGALAAAPGFAPKSDMHATPSVDAPPPAHRTLQSEGGEDIYVIQRGDTLERIALDLLGDSSQWRRIAEANQIEDPRELQVGSRLVIPPRN